MIVSQYPGIETFGGDEALRLSIMAGNGICFRTASNYSGSLMAGLEMDPKQLPDVKGYGFTIRVEGFSRLAPFRNRLCTNPMEWMQRAAERVAELDPGSANAAGDAYAQRAVKAKAFAKASREKLEAVRAGRLSAAEVIGHHPSMRHSAAGLEVVSAEELLEAMGLPSFPAQTTRAAPSALPETGTGHAAVIEAVASGATKPAEIAAATGYSTSRVHQILTDLTATGRVKRTGHGRYHVVGPSDVLDAETTGGAAA